MIQSTDQSEVLTVTDSTADTVPGRQAPRATSPVWYELLDDDSRTAYEALAMLLPHPLHTLGLSGVREFAAPPPPPRATSVTSAVDQTAAWRPSPAAGAERSVRVRVYRPRESDQSLPALLYLHGGGFTVGSLDGVDEACRVLCRQADCVVISVDYRLAPEHPFPAALVDTRAAWGWLAENAVRLGVDDARIAVAGDSAGGNLAAALCLALRGEGQPQPVLQALIYPAVDDTFTRPSWTTFRDAPLLGTADAQWFWRQYVGPTGRAPNEFAAPARAASLAGLAPALVITAEVDPLRDDAETYADLLEKAGVPVVLRRYDGVYHGFFTEVGTFRKAREAVGDLSACLRDAFG